MTSGPAASERTIGRPGRTRDLAPDSGAAGDLGAASLGRTVALVVSLFVVSRLALLVIGLLTQIWIQPDSAVPYPWHFGSPSAVNLWGPWDAGWYVRLARNGYESHPHPDGQVNWVFFPAYPLLSWTVARLVHLPIFRAMLLISNASFLAALFLLHREAEDEFDRPTADATVALFCAVPGSYVFSSGYTESLFLLALAGCLVCLRRKRWLAAGAFAALATLTRNIGIGLVLPFAFAAWPRLIEIWNGVKGPGAGPRARSWELARIAAGAAAPVVGLGGFMLYLYVKTGDPLAFVTAQKAWGRTISNPLMVPVTYLLNPAQLADRFLVDFLFSGLSLGLLVVLGFQRRWALLALGGFFVFVALAGGVPSYQRYCMIMVPLFFAAARLIADHPAAKTSTYVGLASLNGFMMVAWTLGLRAVQ